ncbi:MAG: radical SAM protein [Vulcanimicrobiota bacterium]
MHWVEPCFADRQVFEPKEVFAAGERHHHISNTAYPIAHGKTWGPYRVAERSRHPQLVSQAFYGEEPICLYAHIPFCEKRCSFCEYTVVNRQESQQTRPYMQRLERELETYADLLGRRRIAGFDVGGGTPSFVEASLIESLLRLARRRFEFAPDMRISIETTPRIAADEPDKIRAYRDMGIERISMGIQVIQPDLLRLLNRESNGVEHHFKALDHIRAAGFDNFNVDLMYGFANQSLESWQATLEHALRLNPEAITLYRMRYKLTRISDQADQVSLEQVRVLSRWAKQRLKQAGYLANPGKNTYCRVPGDTGTSDYISRRVVRGMAYLGLGLGAQTFTDTTISYNDGAVAKNLMPYFRSLDQGFLPLQDFYQLPRVHMMAKMICVSFYFGEVNRAAFEHKFHISLEDAYRDEIDFALSEGLMEWTDDCLRMTCRGEDHFSGLCALFHAPSVKGHLMEYQGDMSQSRRLALKVS